MKQNPLGLLYALYCSSDLIVQRVRIADSEDSDGQPIQLTPAGIVADTIDSAASDILPLTPTSLTLPTVGEEAPFPTATGSTKLIESATSPNDNDSSISTETASATTGDSMTELRRLLAQLLTEAAHLEVTTYTKDHVLEPTTHSDAFADATLRAVTTLLPDGQLRTVLLTQDGTPDQAIASAHSTLVARAQEHRISLLRLAGELAKMLDGSVQG